MTDQNKSGPEHAAGPQDTPQAGNPATGPTPGNTTPTSTPTPRVGGVPGLPPGASPQGEGEAQPGKDAGQGKAPHASTTGPKPPEQQGTSLPDKIFDVLHTMTPEQKDKARREAQEVLRQLDGPQAQAAQPGGAVEVLVSGKPVATAPRQATKPHVLKEGHTHLADGIVHEGGAVVQLNEAQAKAFADKFTEVK